MSKPLAAELESAIEAVKAAGEEVVRLQREGLRYGRKGGYELVSEADLKAAEMLHAALTVPFPDTGWLSEEHADTAERLSRERVWVVDPIDGTREYLQGIPEYAISVGLVINGEPTLGVVHNPANGVLVAAVCIGAEEKGRERTGPGFKVLVGRGEHYYDDLPPLPDGAETVGVGSVAYRLALLAAGHGDVCLSGYGRSEWDVAAGVALCRAAGLRVTDVLGEPMRFNQPQPDVRGFLAAEPGLHGELAAFFQRLQRR